MNYIFIGTRGKVNRGTTLDYLVCMGAVTSEFESDTIGKFTLVDNGTAAQILRFIPI